MHEIWKDIPGYDGVYQVSSLGRVKSNRFNKERLLTPSPHKDGYLKVGLSKDKKLRSFTIHKLVMLTFVGDSELPIDHINFIKTDNRLLNLRYISHRENTSRSKKNGASRFTGVDLHTKTQTWRARIYIRGKDYCLGYFKKETEASKAYQVALRDWRMKNVLPSCS